MLAAAKTDETAMIDGAACPWPRAPRVGRRTGQSWYLLQVKSGAEVKVSDFLKPFGFEVYYPKTLVFRKVPKRELTPSQRRGGQVIRRPFQVPIFPGYPYIRFDAADPRCHPLFDFAGVYGLHCTGEKPVIVDDAYVAHLRALEADDGMIPSETSLRELFGVGDTVVIRDGPFRSFTAIVETLPPKLQQQINEGTLSELDDSMCANVAIHIFGQATRAIIPIGSLKKISS